LLHQTATIASWLDVLELMPSPLPLGAFTWFCRTQPRVVKHVKKCNKHSPKKNIIANINPRAVYVAFCNEFMSLQAASLARVRTYIFRQHRTLFYVSIIFYTLVRPIFTHARHVSDLFPRICTAIIRLITFAISATEIRKCSAARPDTIPHIVACVCSTLCHHLYTTFHIVARMCSFVSKHAYATCHHSNAH